MDKIGVGMALAGAAIFIAGAVGLGILFSGHHFHHLAHLTGHKAYSIALATAAAAALPLGMGMSGYGGNRVMEAPYKRAQRTSFT